MHRFGGLAGVFTAASFKGHILTAGLGPPRLEEDSGATKCAEENLPNCFVQK